jgi:hypothetical protein
MWLFDCGLDSIEWRRVILVYSISSSPFILFAYLTYKGKMKKWVTYTIISSFFIAMFGWEIWLNFGLLDGQPVDLRRSVALSCAIPSSINWITNSLGDVALKKYKNDKKIYYRLRNDWGIFYNFNKF